MIRSNKTANTQFAIHPSITERWSPRAFSSKLISEEQLLKLLDAARWAASSFNEQPWRFIIATRQNTEEFERALSCLTETNQTWAKSAAALILTVVKDDFSKNGKPNRCGEHDLGLAMGNLSLQATMDGVSLHQMAGIQADKIREEYSVPEGFHPMTGVALGYEGDPESLEEDWMKESELAARTRKPISEIAFTGSWGKSFGSTD